MLWLLDVNSCKAATSVGRFMQEQLDNWGNMAAFMHMTGRLPAAYADQPGKARIARLGNL